MVLHNPSATLAKSAIKARSKPLLLSSVNGTVAAVMRVMITNRQAAAVARLSSALVAAHAFLAGPAYAQWAPSDGPPSTSTSEGRAPPFVWMARLQAGVGTVQPSPQQDLLDLDGYASTLRWIVASDVARYLTPAFGVGAWGQLSYRSSTPDGGGPALKEPVYAVGAEASLLPLGTDSPALLVVPRFGYGWSLMSIGGRAEAIGGVAYGGEMGLVFPRSHFSSTIGWLNGPTRSSGNLGRDYNFGGFTFLIGGVIDG
jgi:hypothetical protein